MFLALSAWLQILMACSNSCGAGSSSGNKEGLPGICHRVSYGISSTAGKSKWMRRSCKDGIHLKPGRAKGFCLKPERKLLQNDASCIDVPLAKLVYMDFEWCFNGHHQTHPVTSLSTTRSRRKLTSQSCPNSPRFGRKTAGVHPYGESSRTGRKGDPHNRRGRKGRLEASGDKEGGGHGKSPIKPILRTHRSLSE